MGLERHVGTVREGPHQYVVWGRTRRLQEGDPAPDFRLKYLDLADNQLHTIQLSDFKSALILHLIRGINRDSMRATYDLDVLRAGTNLPSEALRIITAGLIPPNTLAGVRKRHGIAHIVASASDVPTKFGLDCAALIKEPDRFLHGGVIFVFARGLVQYAHYPEDMATKPDFFKPISVAREFADDALMDISVASLIAEFSTPIKPTQGK